MIEEMDQPQAVYDEQGNRLTVKELRLRGVNIAADTTSGTRLILWSLDGEFNANSVNTS